MLVWDHQAICQFQRMEKILELGNDLSLECQNLSYIRSFTTGTWYTKVSEELLFHIDPDYKSGQT